jgi:hypoxanthine phosphoribosyltransferase
MAADLYVSWDQYNADIERLARALHDARWPFNQVICIARGGMRVGDVISRIFKTPLAVISTQSYAGEGGTERGELAVARQITMAQESLGDKVILVDDLVDTGVTLDVVKRHLLDHYPAIKEIRTAVLWYKAVSNCRPDYYVHYLPESPWVHQPFEKYDLMSAEDLPNAQ